MTQDELQVSDRPDRNRFEVHVNGALAGFAEYLLTDDLITFTHTWTDPAFEGRGVASGLIRAALEDVRAGGTRKVLPLCPYVTGWLQRHPDYLDMAYH